MPGVETEPTKRQRRPRKKPQGPYWLAIASLFSAALVLVFLLDQLLHL